MGKIFPVWRQNYDGIALNCLKNGHKSCRCRVKFSTQSDQPCSKSELLMFIFGRLDLSQILRRLAAFSFAVLCSLFFTSNRERFPLIRNLVTQQRRSNYHMRLLYSWTSPQRPPWGQKKVAVVERRPLWEGRGVIWHLFSGSTCFLCQL